MRRIPEPLLAKMAAQLSAHDRDEMAIPSYRHRNPAMRWMAWHRVEVVSARLAELCWEKPRSKTAILDFGCGTGVLLGEASRSAVRVVGVDPVLASARLLVKQWQLAVELLTPEAASEELAPATFDIVIAAEVLEHVDPLAPTLGLLRKWLKPGGSLLVSLPTENALYRTGRFLAGFRGDYHHHDAAAIHDAIKQSGFEPRSRREIPLPGPGAIYWVVDYVRS